MTTTHEIQNQSNNLKIIIFLQDTTSNKNTKVEIQFSIIL